jgi:hypothetical protein
MFSWFGSSTSKESELINKIQALETSNPEWARYEFLNFKNKSVIREFMDYQITEDFQQSKN